MRDRLLRKGLFIVFEGPHASGKTFMARSLVKRMKSEGIPAVYTKEPFLKPVKKIAKKISTEKNNNPYALLYLLSADRLLHMEKIRRAISSGTTVVSDRYMFSTLVYQRIQGIPIRLIKKINDVMMPPDLVFFADVPFEVRKERMLKRKRTKDLFYERPKLLLEDRYYNEIKRNLKPAGWYFVLDGQSTTSVERSMTIVRSRLKKRNR